MNPERWEQVDRVYHSALEVEPGQRESLFPADSSKDLQQEVCVRPFPGPGRKWQVFSGCRSEPLWSRNGKELFYRRRDQVLVLVVDAQARSDFSPAKPRLLFEQPGYRGNCPHRGWDISLDGQRFLMVRMEERKLQPVNEMILVQNWFEELKRLCPTGKK